MGGRGLRTSDLIRVNAPGALFVISRQCPKLPVTWDDARLSTGVVPVISGRFWMSRGPHADLERSERETDKSDRAGEHPEAAMVTRAV